MKDVYLCGSCKLRPRSSIASRSLCAQCKADAYARHLAIKREREGRARAADRPPPRAAHPISPAAVVFARPRYGRAGCLDARIQYRGHSVPLLDYPFAGDAAGALRMVESLASGNASFAEFVEDRYQLHRHGLRSPIVAVAD